MARLADRERERYGDHIRQGGDMHDQHRDFMAWAESYDTASAPIRSLDLHEKWMKRLSCSLPRVNSDRPIDVLAAEVVNGVVT